MVSAKRKRPSGRKIYLDEHTMSEFAERVKNRKLVMILPIGAVEGHGNHLPLCTDSIQPERIAERVALSGELDAIIAPPIRYGNCQSTKKFPGTLSIDPDVLRALVRNILLELARNGVRNIVVLSGHAGSVHMAALRQAAQDAVDCFNLNIMVLSDYDIAYDFSGDTAPKDDGHAGMIETSRVLSIRPDLVKMNFARKGKVSIPRFRIVRDPDIYWKNAVDGNPQTASIEFGNSVNEYITKGLIGHIKKML